MRTGTLPRKKRAQYYRAKAEATMAKNDRFNFRYNNGLPYRSAKRIDWTARDKTTSQPVKATWIKSPLVELWHHPQGKVLTVPDHRWVVFEVDPETGHRTKLTAVLDDPEFTKRYALDLETEDKTKDGEVTE